jgi:hypothetical protein
LCMYRTIPDTFTLTQGHFSFSSKVQDFDNVKTTENTHPKTTLKGTSGKDCVGKCQTCHSML